MSMVSLGQEFLRISPAAVCSPLSRQRSSKSNHASKTGSQADSVAHHPDRCHQRSQCRISRQACRVSRKRQPTLKSRICGSFTLLDDPHLFELWLLSNQFEPRIVDRRGKLDPDQRQPYISFHLVMAELVEYAAEPSRTAEANCADECLTLPAIVNKRSCDRILLVEPP